MLWNAQPLDFGRHHTFTLFSPQVNSRFHQGPVEDEADKGVWVLDWNPEDIVRNKGTLEAVPSLF
jgi:hypothetical protein